MAQKNPFNDHEIYHRLPREATPYIGEKTLKLVQLTDPAAEVVFDEQSDQTEKFILPTKTED